MERNKGHIDEGTLHAWLDGALPPDESARVEAHIASCAACSAAAAEARGLVAAASRILTALDDVPGGVAPTRALSERRHRLWTGWPLRAAAGVLFVVAGSLAVLKQMDTDHRDVASSVRIAAPAAPPPAPLTLPQPVAVSPPVAEKLQGVRKKQAAAEPRVTVQEDSVATAAKPVTIAGRVVEASTGQPVPQAVVNLSNPRVSAVTDSTGGYAMAIPATQAANQPSKIDVRRLGYDRATDSVTVAQQASPGDTVRRDFALKPATTSLSQVVVAGTAQKEAPAAGVAGGVAKGAANGFFRSRASRQYTSGCYAIDAPGLPTRIELGLHPRVPSPDSAAFGIAYWFPDRNDSVRIGIGDTAGTKQWITAVAVGDSTLRGQVTRLDSSTVRPFVAKKIAEKCP
jgi:anti-sigma factor RsiW